MSSLWLVTLQSRETISVGDKQTGIAYKVAIPLMNV